MTNAPTRESAGGPDFAQFHVDSSRENLQTPRWTGRLLGRSDSLFRRRNEGPVWVSSAVLSRTRRCVQTHYLLGSTMSRLRQP
jgi:hypothetical protein